MKLKFNKSSWPDSAAENMGSNVAETEESLFDSSIIAGSCDSVQYDEYYFYGPTLSYGEYSKVVLGIHRLTMLDVAVKTIDKNRFKERETDPRLHLVRQEEIDTLKKLKHKNIVRLLEYSESGNLITIIKEYCHNGNLQQYLKSKSDGLLKSEVVIMFVDLINCLDYIQRNGFYHGAIRPENIMLDQEKQIKLIGFKRIGSNRSSECAGQSENELYREKKKPERQRKQDQDWYQPPELSGTDDIQIYTPTLDVWSCGMLLYRMLTNKLPSADSNTGPGSLLKKNEISEIFQTDSNGIPLPEVDDDDDDDGVQDLLKRMLKIQPIERIRMKEILNHSWLHRQYGWLGIKAVSKRLDAASTMDTDVDDRFSDQQQRFNGNTAEPLDNEILNECLRKHGNEVKDIIELRYNVLHKYCYQTATYWLIKQNYPHYKRLMFLVKSLDIAGNHNYHHQQQEKTCRNIGHLQLIRTSSDYDSNDHHYHDDHDDDHDGSHKDYAGQPQQPITLLDSQIDADHDDYQHNVATKDIPPIVLLDDVHDGNCTHQYEKKVSEQNGHSLLSSSSSWSSSRDGSDEVMFHQSNSNEQPSQHTSSTGSGCLNSEEGCCSTTDNNSKDSCSSTSGDYYHTQSDGSVGLSKQIEQNKNKNKNKLKHEPQEKSLSRKLSFIGSPGKRFMSSINLLLNFQTKCSKNIANNEIGSSLSSISEHQAKQNKTNANKNNRFWKGSQSCDNSPFKQKKSPRKIKDQWQSDENIVTNASCLDVSDSGENQTVTPTKNTPSDANGMGCVGKKDSSTLIITCYEYNEDCIQAAMKILKQKGINFKREKNKIRCCVAALNTVIMAFQLEFFSINSDTFVMIKVKKLRGNQDDFYTICNNLRRYFQQKIPCSLPYSTHNDL